MTRALDGSAADSVPRLGQPIVELGMRDDPAPITSTSAAKTSLSLMTIVTACHSTDVLNVPNGGGMCAHRGRLERSAHSDSTHLDTDALGPVAGFR
jgi:hypothetical protein